MKKVLIISYRLKEDVIGSVRIRGLLKYLPLFGWEPTVVTLKTQNPLNIPGNIIEVTNNDAMLKWKSFFSMNGKKTFNDKPDLANKSLKSSFIKILIKLWMDIFAYPDGRKTWLKPANKAASDLLTNNHYDVIISSSAPVTCHLIAKKLKKDFKIPWIADLRDLWTQNHYYGYSRIRRFVDTRLEKKTLSDADIITTVSPVFKSDLQKLHVKNEILMIPNGYDKEFENKGELVDDKFTIVYTGNIYKGKMDLESLFKAINSLYLQNKISPDNFNLEFYSSDHSLIDELLIRYDIFPFVKTFKWVERNIVLKRQKQAQLLLLLRWNDINQKGVCPGKIFEYMAAKRPVISIGKYEGVVNSLIEKTNIGVNLYTYKEIEVEIMKYYNEFNSKGFVSFQGNTKEIEEYSQFNMAKKFSNILEKMTDQNPDKD